MDSRPLMPPMSTTSLPSSSELVPIPPSSASAPILASDILREEVAPLTPAGATMRRLLVGLAVASVGLGALAFERALPGARLAGASAIVTAALAALAWAPSIPYATRAALAVLAGLGPLALGVLRLGPFALLGEAGVGAGASGIVFLTLLPAVLFFRAQYRAFRAARAMLAAALILAVPGLLLLGRATLAVETPLALRMVDVVELLAVATSFAGFLGPETTGACTLWGALLIAVEPAQKLVAAVTLDGHDTSTVLGIVAAVSVSVGASLAGAVAGVGLYQLLAAALAGRARLVDVHRIVGPSAEEG